MFLIFILLGCDGVVFVYRDSLLLELLVEYLFWCVIFVGYPFWEYSGVSYSILLLVARYALVISGVSLWATKSDCSFLCLLLKLL